MTLTIKFKSQRGAAPLVIFFVWNLFSQTQRHILRR